MGSDSDDFAEAPGGAGVYAAFNAFYDEELEASDFSAPAPVVVAPPYGNGSDAGDGSGSSSDVDSGGESGERQQTKEPPARQNAATAGKRRKRSGARFENAADDSDDAFESQQSILKWVRTVPGPLQDVIKNQAVMESANSGLFASGGSVGTGAMISTVFDDGPWVDMCAFLGLATTPGKLYGGIRMSSLKHTLSYILEDDEFSPKIPQSMKYVDEEIVAVFHDPTGDIEGYFHRELAEQLGAALGAGTGVLLRNVSVFTPADATSVGRRRSYLNVVPRNLQRVFLPKSQVPAYGAPVDAYNSERAALADAEDADDESRRAQAAEAQRLLQHDALRHASTELSYLSQRQVVHRNPPVRLDPSAASGAVATEAAGAAKSAKKAKKHKKNGDESSSGLGRWEWGKLVQRKAAPPPTTRSAASTTTQSSDSGTQHALPTSRFTALLSRQIATKRRSIEHTAAGSATLEDDNDDDDDNGDGGDSGRARVRFAAAPEVVEIAARQPWSSADVSESEEVVALDGDATSQSPATRPQFGSADAKRATSNTAEPQAYYVDEEDDDDDDW
ncbi:hypothetical protein PybrP1_006720 [[Pythium] brassicae (nom. inval.)]|nr:hypothetical protein PybrP1_006720 [[Pythium] brassicae (nom. inval.)]